MKSILFNSDKMKPERFFLIIAFLFGVSFLVLTPPFQSPDEINHFYKAYQISEGQFVSVKEDQRVGGYIPVSLVKVTELFLGLRWNAASKINSKTILGQFAIPLNEKEKVFVDFPNTAMYSFVSYLPQASIICVLRVFESPPLVLFYGARFFTLLCWIWSVFYVLKIIPFYKWFFVLMTLLPMSVFINMSLSADMVTNSISFILISYLLKLAYEEDRISNKKMAFVYLLVFLLASAKLVYIPVIVLFILIPKEKWHKPSVYYTQGIGLFVFAFATVVMWSMIMAHLYTPYSVYNTQFRDGITLVSCANMYEQLHYILTHGFYIFKVLMHSMKYSFDMYFQGCIGTFGWLDTYLPMSVIHASYAVLFIVACLDGAKAYTLSLYNKCIILSSLLATLFLILVSQHLTWDCVGGDVILTIQGRYFMPVFPLLFLLCYRDKSVQPKIVVWLVMSFSIVILLLTMKVLYERYYIS